MTRSNVHRWRRIVVALYLTVASGLTVISYVRDARERVPVGLTRQLFERSAPAVVIDQQIAADLDVGFLARAPHLPQRFITVRWDGTWYRPTDQWIDLYAGADDYVRIELDGLTVLERSSPRGTGERRARFLLRQGFHRLAVIYEQDAGGAMLYIGLADAGGVPSAIDRETLFPIRPTLQQVALNRQLLWLRRAAIGAWCGPPLLLLAWYVGRRAARHAAAAARAWWGRQRDGLRQFVRGLPGEPSGTARRWRGPVVALYAVIVVLFLAAVARFHDPETGFTTLIVFGEQFQERALPALRALPHRVYEGSGYDGQFYAQLALEPLLRSADLSEALDSLPYRARRILLSWTAYVLGAGRPAWVVEAYALQNIGFWLLLGALLLRWLPPVNLRHWFAWSACLLGAGAVASVRQALTDLPSAALVTLAYVVSETRFVVVAGAVLGVSGLARETNLLGVAGIDWPDLWRSRRRRSGLIALVLAVLPIVMWLGYMAHVMGPRAWRAGEDNVGLPFAGLAVYVQRAWYDIAFSGWAAASILGLVCLASTLWQAAYLTWRAEWHDRWWRLGMVYALLMVGLGFQVWEGNPGASVRALLPMTLAYNILIVRSRWFWPLLVAGNVAVVPAFAMMPLWPW